MSPGVPLLLAAALGAVPGPVAARRIGHAGPGAKARARLLRPEHLAAAAAGLAVAAVLGGVTGIAAGCAAGGAAAWVVRRRASRVRPDAPVAVAAALDLLATCLRSGLTVADAVHAAAACASGGDAPRTGGALSRVADLLALGGDPDQAWSALAGEPELEPIARMARRSADSGASMACEAENLAEGLRAGAADAAVAAGEKAGVAIAGPLGLCFLPAFVCLGLVPVIVGLAGGILAGGAP